MTAGQGEVFSASPHRHHPELINVAQDIRLLDVDVSKFSHVLRDFRNYIHPYQQMSEAFSPDQHTVEICWQVFRAAYSQMKERGPKVLSP